MLILYTLVLLNNGGNNKYDDIWVYIPAFLVKMIMIIKRLLNGCRMCDHLVYYL